MFFALRKLLIPVVLAAEVVTTLVVADLIGLLPTLGWFVGAFVLGVLVVRRAGARAWATLRGASTDRAQVAGDTPLLFLAGVLLAVPGVLSDVVGLALLTPPGRAFAKGWVARRVGRHVSVIQSSVTRVRGQQAGTVSRRDVQAGELVEDDERPQDA